MQSDSELEDVKKAYVTTNFLIDPDYKNELHEDLLSEDLLQHLLNPKTLNYNPENPTEIKGRLELNWIFNDTVYPIAVTHVHKLNVEDVLIITKCISKGLNALFLASDLPLLNDEQKANLELVKCMWFRMNKEIMEHLPKK